MLFTDFVGVESGDRVLDVGCGTGSLALSIAANSRVAKIVGIDFSAGFIEYARFQSADARLEFQVPTGGANGSFTIKAKVWAVKGVAP